MPIVTAMLLIFVNVACVFHNHSRLQLCKILFPLAKVHFKEPTCAAEDTRDTKTLKWWNEIQNQDLKELVTLEMRPCMQKNWYLQIVDVTPKMVSYRFYALHSGDAWSLLLRKSCNCCNIWRWASTSEYICICAKWTPIGDQGLST